MLYENYQKRILKLAEILKVIRTFRVLIIILISAACASTGGYLATQGMVYDEVECPTTLVYGEEFSYRADALFEDIRYEYSTDSEFTNVSASVPRMPGNYYVRAVSTSAFGSSRYGKVHAFAIQPKPIQVSVIEEEILFGEMPGVSAELVTGDSISCDGYIYADLTKTQTDVTPHKEAVTILDKDGNDVTAAYDLQMQTTPIRFTARPITVTVSSGSHIYDALPFAFHDYALTAGTLAGQGELADQLVATFDSSLIHVGQVENIPTTLRVITSSGLDVSANYKITVVSGTLTVEKRPVKINLNTDKTTVEFPYDGKEHSFTDYTVDPTTPLAEGHREILSSYPTITDAGSVKNVLTFRIEDVEGNDVTANYYSLFVPEDLILKVTPRPITVETPSGEWIYDGQTHEKSEFAITQGTLLQGHTFVFSAPLSITDVGSIENSAYITVLDANGKNVTANYGVTNTFGTLSVQKRSVAIQTASAEWVYDATEHSDATWTVTSEMQLVTGHQFSIVSHPSVSLVSDGEVSNEVVLTILTSEGTDVSANYDLSATYGTLKITPRVIDVSVGGGEWVYDALEHKNDAWEITSGTRPVEGQTVKIESIPTVTNVSQGEVSNAIVLGIYTAEDVNVTDNYTLNYTYGTLKITPRPATIRTGSAEREYNGDPLEQWKNYVCEGFVEGHTPHFSLTGKITNVGSVQNTVDLESVSVECDGLAIEVTNYTITFEYGTLTVIPRDITISTPSDEKIYDGLPLTKIDGWAVENLVPGQTMTLTVTGTQTDAGFSSNTVDPESIRITDGVNEISLDNYQISYVYGTLTVHKRAITVETESQSFIYDGVAHVWEKFALVNDTTLAPNQTISVDKNTAITNVFDGPLENKLTYVILDAAGNDVTKNYEITDICGSLTVTPRPITVKTPSAEKIYDGKPLTCQDGLAVEGLAEGHILSLTMIGSQTVVGFSDNLPDLDTLVIRCGDEQIDLRNYEISYEYGTLTVLIRPITVQSSNGEWIYDGEYHSMTDLAVIVGSLAEGHTLRVEEFAQVRDYTSQAIVNRLIVNVLDEKGEIVSSNYDISYEYGTLFISKRPISILTGNGEWIYDGILHKQEGFTYLSELEIVDGQLYNIIGAPGVTNVLDGKIDNVFTIQIFTQSGDVTENYEITYAYGTLEILPRPISIETNTSSWIYDGQPHFDIGFFYLGEYQILSNHTYLADGYPSVTNVWEGAITNEFSIRIIETVDGETVDRSSNYTVSYAYGKIWIEKRIVCLKTATRSWEYDGQSHSAPTWIYDVGNELILVKDHVIDILSFVTITDVPDAPIDNALTMRVLDADGNDVSENYQLKASFGTLNVTPRKITIISETMEWIYDGLTHTAPYWTYQNPEKTTVLSHYISVIDSTGVIYVGDPVDNELTVTVLDENGESVDRNYKITVVCGTLKINKRPISIYTDNGTWTYDGQEHSQKTWYYSWYDYLLANGDVADVINAASVKTVAQSWTPNTFELQIWNADRTVDVTENYDISYSYGWLNVNQRQIWIQTATNSWMYDAQPHSDDGFTYLSSTEIVKGQSYKTIGVPSVTNAWEYSIENYFGIEIYDFDGVENVTENYEIIYSYGWICVTKRPISILTNDGEWIYDGLSHWDTGFTYQTDIHIVEDQKVHVYSYPTVTNVWDGVCTNYFDIRIYDQTDTYDVTDNYDITYSYGTIRILKREIEIETNTTTWIYDAQPHFDTGFKYLSDLRIVDGQKAHVWSYPTVTNVREGVVDNVFEIFIYDESLSFDYTDNYHITYTYGKIKIDPRPVLIQTKGQTWVYDGEAHSYPVWEYASQNVYTIIPGHWVEVEGAPSVDEVKDGEIKNVFVLRVYEYYGGMEISDNYDFEYAYEYIRITKRSISILTDSNSWVYDALPHSDDGWSYAEDTPYYIVTGQTFSTVDVPVVTNVKDGRVDNDFALQIFAADGVTDVSDNYDVTYTYGTIEITRRAISILTNSNSWVYDALPHSEPGFTYLSAVEIVEGQKVHVVDYPSVTNVWDGKVSNKFTVKIYDSTETVDVTDNYDITYTYGTIEITKREISIKTNTTSWVYDALPHFDTGFTYLSDIEIVEGQKVHAEGYPSVTNVWDGKVTNKFAIRIYDSTDTVDVTKNYDITYTYGTIEITKREISIVTNTNSWVYDALDHSEQGWTYAQNSPYQIVAGQTFAVHGAPVVTNVWDGTKTNEFTITVCHADGETDVTENYEISYAYGTVKITKRAISIVTNTNSWVYDAQTHSEKGFTYAENSPYQIVEGQTFTVHGAPTVTNVWDGEVSNVFTITLCHANGRTDVTENYEISYAYGTIKVTRRSISIVTNTNEWIYDGKSHSDDGWSYAENTPYRIVEGQTASTVGVLSAKNVREGTVSNVFAITVCHADGETDVTGNYDISYTYGTIRILPRPVAVQTNSNSWVYDGEAHSDQGWRYGDASEYHFLSFHIVQAQQPIPTVTNVGEGEVSNQFALKVFSRDGEELTDESDNYTITYSYGTIKITPKSCTVDLGGIHESKRYDGTPLNYAVDLVLPDGFLVAGHVSTLQATGSILDIGRVDLTLSGDIKDAQGRSVLENYEVILTNGVLEILPCADILITTGSDTKLYDGEPLTNYDGAPYYTVTDGSLLAGHTVTVRVTGSQTAIGQSENTFEWEITDAEGNNVSAYYRVTCARGTLTVLPPVTFSVTTESAEKRYDGTPLSNAGHLLEAIPDASFDQEIYIGAAEQIDPESGALIYRYAVSFGTQQTVVLYMTVQMTGSQTEIGSSENTATVTVTDAEGNDLSNIYGVETLFGTLTVDHVAEIQVTTEGAEKRYDGMPLRHDVATFEILGGELMAGHELTLHAVGVLVGVGETDNIYELIITDAEGNDVTALYDVAGSCGKLKIIHAATISVSTEGAKKPYDGTALVQPSHTVEITEGALLEGHSIREVNVTGSQTFVGISDNTVELVIVDLAGNDVSEYYQIDKTLGKLTVTHPSVIHVTTESASKLYDKTALTAPGILASLVNTALPEGFSATLTPLGSETVEGVLIYHFELTLTPATGDAMTHYIAIYATGTQTDVGESENTYEIVITDIEGTNVTSCFTVTDEAGSLSVLPIAGLSISSGGASKPYDGEPLTNSEISVEILADSVFAGLSVEIVESGTENVEEITYQKYLIRVTDANGTTEYKLLVRVSGTQTEVGSSLNTLTYLLLTSEGEDVTDFFDITKSEGILNVTGDGSGEGGSGEGGSGEGGSGEGGSGEGGSGEGGSGEGGSGEGGSGEGGSGEGGSGEGGSGEGGSGGGGFGAGNLDTSGDLAGSEMNNSGGDDGPPATVLKIVSDKTGRFYVRLMSYGDYHGKGFYAATEYPEALQGGYSYHYLTGLTLQNNGYQQAQAVIESFTSDYLLPYHLAMGDFDYDIQSSDVFNTGDSSKTYTVGYYLYTGYGSDLQPMLGELSEAEARYAAFVERNYLQIDPETLAYMQDVIAEQGFDENDPDLVEKVATYIQNAAVYNLKYPIGLDGEENMVVAFLSKYKEGVCRHYAASATMLYRALGIPARYTVGYSGATKAGQESIITSKQGHAWTEVYLKGIGWIPVEVTGSGFDDGVGGSGGGGGTTAETVTIEIKPVDVDKGYDGTPLLPENRIEVPYLSELDKLISKGYTYEVVVEGSRTERGESESRIVSFVLYDPQGHDVTAEFNLVFKPGKIRITASQIVIGVYQLQKTYDGTPLAFEAGDYWIKSGLPEGYTLEFSLAGVSITEVGELSREDLQKLPYVVRNAQGEDVTENYYLKIAEGGGLRIAPRTITLSSASQTKAYDGTALSSPEVTLTFGELIAGHRLEARATGSITDVGEVKNKIDEKDVKILDAQGKDVTSCYEFEIICGTLTVVDP